jgi:hypothetical protein
MMNVNDEKRILLTIPNWCIIFYIPIKSARPIKTTQTNLKKIPQNQKKVKIANLG